MEEGNLTETRTIHNPNTASLSPAQNLPLHPINTSSAPTHALASSDIGWKTFIQDRVHHYSTLLYSPLSRIVLLCLLMSENTNNVRNVLSYMIGVLAYGLSPCLLHNTPYADLMQVLLSFECSSHHQYSFLISRRNRMPK